MVAFPVALVLFNFYIFSAFCSLYTGCYKRLSINLVNLDGEVKTFIDSID